ncbi:MAG: RNA-guided pseudouridylation complex pseudouridine synthase subunit Cbf5 [Candidatus Thermoplasmatota archaeon]|nr:RNA-guided pseudouridylation complex pseudouridine synthase subunit Cbf5 [Candidatus Thermoplasmatota archaeon]
MLIEKRRRLIKAEAETNPNYGKEPSKRSVEELIDNGVTVVDKPAGPTSHQVSAWVRDIFGINKTGHGGTLDPNVTGILPVALSNATKAIGLMHSVGKEYVCVMRLHGDESEESIMQVCSQFIGKIRQTPPKEAAVKREEREREIYYLDILEINGRDVLFRVGCEGGTYIRVLCGDIGKKLGCDAHMHELRRTRSGVFEESEAHTLHDVLDSYIFWKEDGDEEIKKIIRHMEDLLIHLPCIVIRDSAVDAICHGAYLTLPGVLQIDTGIKKESVVALKTLKGEGVAIGTSLMSTRDIMDKDKGIVVDVNRVLMRKGTYPPMWKKT